MSQITVYENIKFDGLYRTFTADVLDLKAEHFDKVISSVKVAGQPWLLYEQANHEGEFLALEEGEYPTIALNDRVSSLALVNEDLSSPQITLYEHSHERGRKIVVTQETNLFYGDMNDTISSHEVQSGAWLLYEHLNRDGRCIVARAGEYLPDYRDIHFNDQVSHLYPLRPGRSAITATILWDKKKKESERVVRIDQIVYNNNTGSEQALTATSTKEYEKYVSHSFEFSIETSIKLGASFTLEGVASVQSELTNTFKVTKGETESLTTRKKVELSMPVKILPYTKVSVNFMCKEVRVSVPVELTFLQGTKTVTETGTYRCDSGTDTFIDMDSQAISKD